MLISLDIEVVTVMSGRSDGWEKDSQEGKE